MKQWLNKCGKCLARISGKTITRFLDLWTQEKVNEICIRTTDRHTVGKLPSSLICLLEKKNGKAEFHVVLSATQLCGLVRAELESFQFNIPSTIFFC